MSEQVMQLTGATDRNVRRTGAMETDRNVCPTGTEGETPRAAKTFVSHAKLIGAITFLSRLLGMARESIAANYFGANAIYSAFTFAFTIPNLFRKLLGE